MDLSWRPFEALIPTPCGRRRKRVNWPVSSIRNIHVVVLVIAIDCSLIRYCLADELYFPYYGWPLWFRVAFAGSLPMASAVAICGFMILARCKRGWPFLSG